MFKIFRRFAYKKPVSKPQRLASHGVENEPILGYLKGSKERKELQEVLSRMVEECPDIPIQIGKEKFTTGTAETQKRPHEHQVGVAKFYYASKDQVDKAIKEAIDTQESWRKVKIEKKHEIWMKAADLMAGKYRQELNASIMLGQAKTAFQAEIDTVELIDFLRFGAEYLMQIAQYTPLSPSPKIYKNTYHLRPLDGFIAAVTPFNFTAIGGNLAFTPTLLGNCSIWKPSETAILSNWLAYKIMLEAGVPPGVVSFLPTKPEVFGETITNSKHFAGLNFTGSVATFRKLWVMIANNIENYSCFPRMIGECGGKNYHFVHPSADVMTVVTSAVRSAFEYSGQKCSACSRMYVPESLWSTIAKKLQEETAKLKIGDVRDFSTFTSAVIDEKAFDRIAEYLEQAKTDPALEIICGGEACKTEGYFAYPTIIKTTDPCHKMMTEEIFGPVLTVYVYKDSEVSGVLKLVNESTNYALTGAIFANDKKFIASAVETLRMSAGNFYINDKCTGSVVAQQPFGGGRLSGTNDKAGSPAFVYRFASPQVIKETFVKLTEVDYPYMR